MVLAGFMGFAELASKRSSPPSSGATTTAAASSGMRAAARRATYSVGVGSAGAASAGAAAASSSPSVTNIRHMLTSVPRRPQKFRRKSPAAGVDAEVLHQVAVGADLTTPQDASRNAHDRGSGRHVVQHHRIGADDGA